MLRSLATNVTVQVVILGLAALFVLLWTYIPPDILVIFLNGIFVGSLVTVAAAYYKLLRATLRGDTAYDRTRFMTLSIAILWFSVIISVLASVYARMTDTQSTVFVLSAVARYLAIVAALMQMRSLDYGWAMFHAHDRVMIWASTFLGVTVGIGVVAMQLVGF